MTGYIVNIYIYIYIYAYSEGRRVVLMTKSVLEAVNRVKSAHNHFSVCHLLHSLLFRTL